MTAKELLDDLRELVRLGAIEPKQSSVFNYLAEAVYDARLANGQRILDASDFAAWLRELADSSRMMLVQNGNSRPMPTAKRLVDTTCPRCGHIITRAARNAANRPRAGRVCRCC